MGELPFGGNIGSVKAIPFVRKAYVSFSFLTILIGKLIKSRNFILIEGTFCLPLRGLVFPLFFWGGGVWHKIGILRYVAEILFTNFVMFH